VETRYLGRDPRPIEPQMADAIARAVRADAGSVLAFLPGAAEIRRTAAQLEGRLGPDTDVVALYGALAGDEQDRAIAPAPPGRRKIVLATSIAETSITIEGVRIVVDSGLARVPRFEPDVGVTRLETVRVSRAAADQRRGRAGRIEPGICYRLWDEPQTASLEPFARPEILSADLSSFALDLVAWGSTPELRQATACRRAAGKSATYRSPRSPILAALVPSVGTMTLQNRVWLASRCHDARASGTAQGPLRLIEGEAIQVRAPQ
jgi:ATP-dependent helicase HrpB